MYKKIYIFLLHIFYHITIIVLILKVSSLRYVNIHLKKGILCKINNYTPIAIQKTLIFKFNANN